LGAPDHLAVRPVRVRLPRLHPCGQVGLGVTAATIKRLLKPLALWLLDKASQHVSANWLERWKARVG
jgi:hypothetical protein